MGDWCGSANDRKPKVEKESGAEREPEEPELASTCHPVEKPSFSIEKCFYLKGAL
jgi:hypothetical protein